MVMVVLGVGREDRGGYGDIVVVDASPGTYKELTNRSEGDTTVGRKDGVGKL